jgi:hemoglobin
MPATLDSSETLYDRIGGKAAVDLFYDKIMKDSLLLPFFAGVDLKRQRGKQAAFLTAAVGGPTKYTGKDLRHGHAHLVAQGMSDAHCNAVAVHLQSTLRELAVPAPLIAEVMGLVGSTRDDVLGR